MCTEHYCWQQYVILENIHSDASTVIEKWSTYVSFPSSQSPSEMTTERHKREYINDSEKVGGGMDLRADESFQSFSERWKVNMVTLINNQKWRMNNNFQGRRRPCKEEPQFSTEPWRGPPSSRKVGTGCERVASGPYPSPQQTEL